MHITRYVLMCTINGHIVLKCLAHTYVEFVKFCYTHTDSTPCPLYENDKIIQQPADFLKLSETYSSAATGFIHQMAGNCPYVIFVTIYNTIITKLYSNTCPCRLSTHMCITILTKRTLLIVMLLMAVIKL